jgi:ribosomal protein S18 acetylase RimI-like enzyme
MYGVDTSVHPEYRSRGVGGLLMDARFAVLRSLNLRGMIAGSMIIDYEQVADAQSAEAYVADVVAGRRFDTNLSKQLRKGFKVHNLIPNYVEDPRTRNWAAAILWENPEYRPTAPAVVPAVAARHELHLRAPRPAYGLGAV